MGSSRQVTAGQGRVMPGHSAMLRDRAREERDRAARNSRWAEAAAGRAKRAEQQMTDGSDAVGYSTDSGGQPGLN